MKQISEKPLHRHTCKSCTWLATLEHPGKFAVADACDVYFCDKVGEPTIVTRYGPGTNVAMCVASEPTKIPEFNEGVRLARLKGMLP